MGAILKIIRIIGLYVVFFIVSAIISASLLDSLPDAIEALFILVAPVVLIIWYEKRRAAKIAPRTSPASSHPARRRRLALDEREAQSFGSDPLPEYQVLVPASHSVMSEEAPEESMPSRSDRPEASAPTTSQTAIPSKVPDRPTPSRTRELRERLFGDDSSIFDPKNTDHVQAIVARSSAVQEESHHSDAPASPQPYLSTQDNAELVRVGRAAREALEAASLLISTEK